MRDVLISQRGAAGTDVVARQTPPLLLFEYDLLVGTNLVFVLLIQHSRFANVC